MKSDETTDQILREIRDGIGQTNERLDVTREDLGKRIDVTNERLDATNERLDATNERLDVTNERLDASRHDVSRVVAEAEIRTATEIAAVQGTLRDIRALLANRLDLSDRVGVCERDIAELKGRLASP